MSAAKQSLRVEELPVAALVKPLGSFRDPTRAIPSGTTGRDWL